MGNNWGHVKDNHPRKPKKLLDLAKEILRLKHYSIRTEEAYIGWMVRYIHFHNRRHPKDMGVPEIEAFLTHLPVVLTKDEVKRVIMAMPGVHQLIAKLLYGSERLTFKDFNKVLTWTDMQSILCTH